MPGMHVNAREAPVGKRLPEDGRNALGNVSPYRCDQYIFFHGIQFSQYISRRLCRLALSQEHISQIRKFGMPLGSQGHHWRDIVGRGHE
jgi:hypothetical protein